MSLHSGGSLDINAGTGVATVVAIEMSDESCEYNKAVAWDAKKEKVILC